MAVSGVALRSKSIFDRAVPYVASVATVLAALQLLDYADPRFLIMSHRSWESTYFKVDYPTYSSLLVLTLVMIVWILLTRPWALPLPLVGVLSLLILNPPTSLAIVSLISVAVTLVLGRRYQDYATGALAMVFVVEAASLLHWLVFASLGLRNPLQALTSLEQSLYYLAAQLSPNFMLAFTFVSICVPIIHLIRRPERLEAASLDRPKLSNRAYFALGLTLLLSAVAAVYPYLPNINPNQVNPGVDINGYVEDFYGIAADPSKILTAMGGSRPIFYLLFLAFQKASSLDPLKAIQLIPILLNPLLCVSAFVFTREATGDSSAAAYAAFFTASGFTLQVGMYGYFLADMLMLSIIFLSLATLVKALREKSKLYMVAAVALGSLFVFTHPWTFDQYMAAVGGAMILTLIQLGRGGSTHEAGWLIIYCLAVASTDVLKLLLLRGSVEGFATLGFLVSSLTTPATFWLDLVNSSRFYVSGYLSNMPLLTLAAIGLAKAREWTIPNLILWVLTAASSFVYLIGNTVVKSRLLYNIPVGVLAAYGLSYVDGLKVDSGLKTVIKAAVVVSLLSYLFRDLANLV